jgi:prolyl-tRNA editing enzyme YbaK/EbsC (Cys-tRNA(Pro) deacylase)
MEHVLKNVSVQRVIAALNSAKIPSRIQILSNSARSAMEAAEALDIEVGQIASSIVFRLPDEQALLIITSGRHRVNTDLVARNLNIEKLHRADADFVRNWSGFAIGGISPLGWLKPVKAIIDEALNEYEIVWAAAGHPHAVFPTSYEQLIRATGAVPMRVAED